MALKLELQLLLATTNKGKMEEFIPFFQNSGITLLNLTDFDHPPAIEETGQSFEENAALKARAIAKHYGIPALADDSGLVIPALNGAPGIFSSRYGGDIPLLPGETVDQRNIRKLLINLADIDDPQRKAFFKSVLAVASPDGQMLTAAGEWHGEILRQSRGENGFGYDPVFFDPNLRKSAAELSRAEKAQYSHRGIALRLLLQTLPDFLHGWTNG